MLSAPVDSASAELLGPRPTTSRRGKPSAITYSWGGRTPSFAATGSAAARRSGSSASAYGRAPSMPSNARSPYRYTPVEASREQKANSSAVVVPPTSQPRPPSRAARKATNSHALSRLSATAPRGAGKGALGLSAVFRGEAAWRPVRLGRVAPARAVEGRDVLEGDQDVPVELDMGDVLDR